MGEIKSTLELALERTKKMAISDKEKEEIKKKELLEKANALFHRYQEGHAPLHELQKEIERMDEKTSGDLKKLLLSRWIDALSLREEDERLLKGIEWLRDGRIREALERFRRLSSQYQEDEKKAKQRLRAQLEETLKREGIAGSAIEPNVEGSVRWKETMERLGKQYGKKLEGIREELRTL